MQGAPNRRPTAPLGVRGSAVPGRRAPIPRLDHVKHRPDLYEDPLQFLWAISYSDLLMVLMSFFILFFEMTDSVGTSALQRVMIAVQDKVATTPAQKAGTSTEPKPALAASGGAPAAGAATRSSSLGAVSRALEDNKLPFVASTQPGALTIDFPDNLYKPGEFAVPAVTIEELKRALAAVRPFAKDLTITFIGHTDATPIGRAKRHSRVIDSNLVLSNLRAARAVELALTEGFDPKSVVAQGTGEYSRNTRSLSLRISERSSP